MPSSYSRATIAANLAVHGFELLGDYVNRRTPTLIRCLIHNHQQLACPEHLVSGEQMMACCRKQGIAAPTRGHTRVPEIRRTISGKVL